MSASVGVCLYSPSVPIFPDLFFHSVVVELMCMCSLLFWVGLVVKCCNCITLHYGGVQVPIGSV